MRLLFDIETDGLLDTLTTIHCICAHDLDTGEDFGWRPHEIEQALEVMGSADELIAHNGYDFDFPAIQKVYPNWKPRGKLTDTLVLSRLIESNVKEGDFPLMKRGILPGGMAGSHSLKAWGYRLGELKGDFGETTDWSEFTESMFTYCQQDVRVTRKLWEHLDPEGYSQTAVDLELQTAQLIAKQTQNGFVFDVKAAEALYQECLLKKVELTQTLKDTFGTWWASNGETVPKRTAGPRTEGAAYTKIKKVEFNPGSRSHIAKRLKDFYGWEPEAWTPSGEPQVDEGVLSKLEYPEAQLMNEYLILGKFMGQLADGNNGWLKKAVNGKIHGRVNTNGAVTGRATHSNPNLGQVPSLRVDKDGNKLMGIQGHFGVEARSLFTVPDGWVLMGSDASGLELRCLAHFMARWDKGKYAREVLDGDIHTVNQEAAGLPTRPQAKTFIYAFLYGAGDEKIGSIVAPKSPKAEKVRKGRKLKTSFLNKTPALKALRNAVGEASKRGWLKGLDGRKVYVRSQHAALNTLLQSAGALICKKWIVTVDELMKSKGYTHGWDGDYAYCAWVHDEIQVACRTPEIAEVLGETCKEAMSTTESFFNFRCPLDAEYSVGTSWAETH